jgi:hypothetical protein
MDTTLGLLGVVAFIIGMLALSAGVTWLVVRLDAIIRGARRTST